ncbi:MAG TPA: DUF2726 domain-containing protein [Steroidobacteraceae bacterium]|nr:DUF2726 domain-containing protein [Steroidobacteraceae bacterium]
MDVALLRVIFPLIGLVALLGVATALAAVGKRRGAAASVLGRPWPLEAKRTLLTEPERMLYERLVRAAPKHIVLAQVQLQHLVRFKRGAWSPGIENRISKLSVDFVVLAPDASIVAAIELDDASHAQERRRAADARKTHALESAGIPLLRWSVRQMPTVQTIESALASALARASRLAG